MLNDIFKSIGPIIAAAMAGKFESGDFRFDGGKVHFDGGWEGVPLSEFDQTQAAPEKVLVAGPTKVRIAQGEVFRIATDGEGAASVRFALRNGKLAVTRDGSGGDASLPCVVDIIMPPPRNLSVVGAGSIKSSTLAAEAKVSVAGSGSIRLDGIDCERLKASLMGSGRVEARGNVGRLKLASAGSGESELSHLVAASANLTVTGSGAVELASDGEIEAKIMGSGSITIHGRARCQVQSMGSGRFNCIPRDPGDDSAEQAPKPPKPPKPLKSGKAKKHKGSDK